jgi:hypothetical protein
MVTGIVAVVKRTNPSFLSGIPELLVLGLLSRREMYGYLCPPVAASAWSS